MTDPVMTTVIDRGSAVSRVADALADRHSFVVVVPPATVADLTDRLADIPDWTAYVDTGAPTVLCTGLVTAVQVLTDLLPAPTAMVVTVPKTVPAATLTSALDQEIPADGSRDLLLLHDADDSPTVWPLLFLDALARVDPRAAATVYGPAWPEPPPRGWGTPLA